MKPGRAACAASAASSKPRAKQLRRELGAEPSLADLAARVGTDEQRLGRTIVRITTIESTSALSAPDTPIESALPDVCLPPEQPAPDRVYESSETKERVRRAIASLPARERKVIALYYYRDVTMKQIGAEIGVNESRVSQLHARAIQRLKKSLDLPALDATTGLGALLDFAGVKARMAKAQPQSAPMAGETRGVVLPYPMTSRAARNKSASLNGFGSQRHPDSSRKRSASVPATSPVTKITRRASAGELAAMAR